MFLKVLYYMFFIVVFVLALLIFLRIVDFYFYSPGVKNFLINFINNINF